MDESSTGQPHGSARRVTRLAPSPTGALHLGNARTFLVNFTLAQQQGWDLVLRIDDLEGPRVKAGADRMALEDLQWLGLQWNGPVVYQSHRRSAYDQALARLVAAGRIYGCRCTRSQIDAAATRRGRDGSAIYPGLCRPERRSPLGEQIAGLNQAARFAVETETITFTDGVIGVQQFDARQEVGDFILRKAGGEYAYQLATVVDDLDAGVTDVVRGMDLLHSTVRQIMVYEALGASRRVPNYVHLPLILGPDDLKLAKRHGDTRLSSLRQEGVSAGQVRAMLARWSGFTPSGDEIGIDEWIDRFSLEKLPREPITYDDARDRPAALSG